MKRKIDLHSYLIYTISMGAYWACVCTTVGFASPYLQGRDFGSGQLGIIMAIANLISLLLSLYLSARTDVAGEASVFDYLFALLAMQVVSLGLLFTNVRIMVALAYVFMGGSVLAGAALYVKLFVTLSKFGVMGDYGRSRAAGSLSYGITSFAAGAIMKSAPSEWLLMLNGFFALVQIVSLISLKKNSGIPTGRPAATEKTLSTKSGGSAEILPFLRRNPGFPMFLLGIALIFMVHNATSTFLINIVEHMGGDVADMGNISGFAIFVEIPVMMLYGRLNKKLCRRVLMISFGFFVLKSCLTTAAWSIPVLFLAFAFRAVAFSLYTPAVVDYIATRIPYEDSGKAQGLAANVPQLGSVIGSVLFGFMFDNYAVPLILLCFCIAIILGSAAACYGIRKIQ